MAQSPLPKSLTVDVPVKLVIGDQVLQLGRLGVAVPTRAGQIPASLANLLRAAADDLVGSRHGWPRQTWYIGDSVQLPASVARGTVVQVDSRRKHYLVDTGRGRQVEVSWHEVDRPTSTSELKAAAAVAATLDQVSRGRYWTGRRAS